jgi:hypothetical protein
MEWWVGKYLNGHMTYADLDRELTALGFSQIDPDPAGLHYRHPNQASIRIPAAPPDALLTDRHYWLAQSVLRQCGFDSLADRMLLGKPSGVTLPDAPTGGSPAAAARPARR